MSTSDRLGGSMTDLDRIRAVLDKCAADTRPGENDYVQRFDAYEAAIDAISRIAYPEEDHT